jgi:hypothetical protein
MKSFPAPVPFFPVKSIQQPSYNVFSSTKADKMQTHGPHVVCEILFCKGKGKLVSVLFFK